MPVTQGVKRGNLGEKSSVSEHGHGAHGQDSQPHLSLPSACLCEGTASSSIARGRGFFICQPGLRTRTEWQLCGLELVTPESEPQVHTPQRELVPWLMELGAGSWPEHGTWPMCGHVCSLSPSVSHPLHSHHSYCIGYRRIEPGRPRTGTVAHKFSPPATALALSPCGSTFHPPPWE